MELEPCPFCGGKAFFLVRNEYEQSPKSGATTYRYVSAERAIEAWNRRVGNDG